MSTKGQLKNVVKRLTHVMKLKLHNVNRLDENPLNSVRLPEYMEGMLQKKSPSLLAGWQSRFCVLKDRKLSYFKSNRPDDLKTP